MAKVKKYPSLQKYAALRSEMRKFRLEERLAWEQSLRQTHVAKPYRRRCSAM